MVRSKAAVTTAELGDDYIMMGPYHEPTVKLEVEVCEPDHPIIREVMDQMRSNGIKVLNLLIKHFNSYFWISFSRPFNRSLQEGISLYNLTIAR